MPLSAAQYARIIAPLGEQTTRQSGVRTRVMSLAVPPTTGVVTYKQIGFQPKGLIFLGVGWANQSPTTPIAAGYFAYGAADGTSQFFQGGTIQDNIGVSINSGAIKSDICVGFIPPGGAMTVRAALSGFSSANGGSFSLNWLSAVGTSTRLTVMLVGGDDVSFACGTAIVPTATGAFTLTSSLAFEPNLVGLSNSVYGTFTTGTAVLSSDLNVSLGWANAEHEFCTVEKHAYNTADSSSRRAYRHCLLSQSDGAGGEGTRIHWTAFTPTGVTLTKTVGTSAPPVGWIALRVPAPIVGTLDSPTSQGRQSVPISGTMPRGLLVYGTDQTAVDTEDVENHLTVGATDGTTLASSSHVGEHGRPTIRAKTRGDYSYLYRPQISYGDNLWQTGPSIRGVRFAPDAIDLTWERANTPSVRVLQNVNVSGSGPATIAATTAGSTIIVIIAQNGAAGATWGPSDASNGAYTLASGHGSTTQGAYTYYFHNSAAGVTSVALVTAGVTSAISKVIEVVGLANETPLTSLKTTGVTAYIDTLLSSPSPLTSTREGFLAGNIVYNGAPTGIVCPGWTLAGASQSINLYGIGIDGIAASDWLQIGISTTARRLDYGNAVFFRAPTVTPRKIGYVVFGEALLLDTGLAKAVADTVVVTDVFKGVQTPLALRPAAETVAATDVASASLTSAAGGLGDVLQRRSMMAIGLPYLRGGVIPGGA